jgi:hypothetical protein
MPALPRLELLVLAAGALLFAVEAALALPPGVPVPAPLELPFAELPLLEAALLEFPLPEVLLPELLLEVAPELFVVAGLVLLFCAQGGRFGSSCVRSSCARPGRTRAATTKQDRRRKKQRSRPSNAARKWVFLISR